MLSDEFTQLNEFIRSAGAILNRYFGEQLQLNYKSTSADYSTKADIEAEQTIIRGIETIFPDYNIIAEEVGEKYKGSPYTFVIDPLDGTNNFVLGVPVFTSSVALMKDKEVIYGVVYNPITDDMYYASKGKGAFLNEVPISVNKENEARNITVSYFCNYVAPKERRAAFKGKLSGLGIRRHLDLWAPAFCYCKLASGVIEGIINDKIELYDFAAGKLIAAEAGAKITGFSGENIDDDTADTFIVSNGTSIHDFLVEHVSGL